MKLPRRWEDVLLSVIVPAYNEEPVIRESIERLREVPLKLEIIVVDDGSVDRTGAIIEELREEGLVDVVIHQPRNMGKGAAIRAGLARATGHIVVVQDADLEYDPMELKNLMQPIVQGRADAVYGSRFQGGPRRVLYFWHSVGNRFLTLVSNMLTNLNLTDVETCYKMVRRDVAQSLPLVSERFGIEVELTARLAKAGARIWELPISYSGRTYAEGKKIGWRDGVAALWYILRFNVLSPKRTSR